MPDTAREGEGSPKETEAPPPPEEEKASREKKQPEATGTGEEAPGRSTNEQQPPSKKDDAEDTMPDTAREGAGSPEEKEASPPPEEEKASREEKQPEATANGQEAAPGRSTNEEQPSSKKDDAEDTQARPECAFPAAVRAYQEVSETPNLLHCGLCKSRLQPGVMPPFAPGTCCEECDMELTPTWICMCNLVHSPMDRMCTECEQTPDPEFTLAEHEAGANVVGNIGETTALVGKGSNLTAAGHLAADEGAREYDVLLKSFQGIPLNMTKGRPAKVGAAKALAKRGTTNQVSKKLALTMKKEILTSKIWGGKKMELWLVRRGEARQGRVQSVVSGMELVFLAGRFVGNFCAGRVGRVPSVRAAFKWGARENAHTAFLPGSPSEAETLCFYWRLYSASAAEELQAHGGDQLAAANEWDRRNEHDGVEFVVWEDELIEAYIKCGDERVPWKFAHQQAPPGPKAKGETTNKSKKSKKTLKGGKEEANDDVVKYNEPSSNYNFRGWRVEGGVNVIQDDAVHQAVTVRSVTQTKSKVKIVAGVTAWTAKMPVYKGKFGFGPNGASDMTTGTVAVTNIVVDNSTGNKGVWLGVVAEREDGTSRTTPEFDWVHSQWLPTASVQTNLENITFPQWAHKFVYRDHESTIAAWLAKKGSRTSPTGLRKGIKASMTVEGNEEEDESSCIDGDDTKDGKPAKPCKKGKKRKGSGKNKKGKKRAKPTLKTTFSDSDSDFDDGDDEGADTKVKLQTLEINTIEF
jgi:hypothetical protein